MPVKSIAHCKGFCQIAPNFLLALGGWRVDHTVVPINTINLNMQIVNTRLGIEMKSGSIKEVFDGDCDHSVTKINIYAAHHVILIDPCIEFNITIA